MITISSLYEKAKHMPSAGRLALAAAHDEDALKAVCAAKREGLAEPILVGRADKIREILVSLGEDPDAFETVPAETDTECAEKAVALAHDGRVQLLMKGLVSTADLMRAALNKEKGIRTANALSHIMFYQIPNGKLYALTDGGMFAFPDLAGKQAILKNCAETMHKLGWGHINAACLCGAEQINPKFVSMTDAAALSAMDWSALDMTVFGPVGLDLAVSPEACRHKRFTAPGAGDADILLVPNYEVGNNLGKALSLFGGAKNAGIIVGAAVPVVLVSRADPAEVKLLSIALGALAGAAR